MTIPLHSNELARLAALRQCHILDTEPEEVFDDAVQLAAYICQTPMAAISLIDHKRQWCKARIGIASQEFERKSSFCAETIRHSEIFVVPDTAEDPRFLTNRQVTQAVPVRFYAGIPLITPDGLPLGTLCVQDSVPRELTPEQVAALWRLSHQVIAHLQQRRSLQDAERNRMLYELASHRFLELFQGLPVACCCYNAQGQIIEWNRAFEKLYNRSPEQILEKPLWDVICRKEEQSLREIIAQVFAGASRENLEYHETGLDGKSRYVLCSTFPLYNAGPQVLGGICTSINITAHKEAELTVQRQLLQMQEHRAELEAQRQQMAKHNASRSV